MKHDYTDAEIGGALPFAYITLEQYKDLYNAQAAEIARLKAELEHTRLDYSKMRKELLDLLRVLDAHDATEGEETARSWKQSIKRLKEERDKAQSELDALPMKLEELGPWPGQQEAIDKAFENCGDDCLTSDSSLVLWTQEAPARLAIAQAYDKARPQAAEIAALRAELEQTRLEYSEMKRLHDKAQAELAAMNVDNEGLKVILAVESDAKAALDAELTEIKDYLWPNQTGLPNKHRNALVAIKRREEIQERYISDLKAELAALRQPILADDGRSLGDVHKQAWHKERENGGTYIECEEAAAQAVVAAARPAIEAECLAQAVRRMEAVPVVEVAGIIRKAWLERGAWIDPAAADIRARFISAAKGEGQQPIKGLEGLTKERCLRIAEIEGDSTVAAGQPILADDDGRSLEQVAIQEHEKAPLGIKWFAAANAVAAVAITRAVQRIEAVTEKELQNQYWKGQTYVGTSQAIERIRARLIAAAKGDRCVESGSNVAVSSDGAVYHNPEKTYAQAEEAECVMKWLDSVDAPTQDIDGKHYSLVGRIQAWAAKGEAALSAIDDEGNPATTSDEPSEPYHAQERCEVPPIMQGIGSVKPNPDTEIKPFGYIQWHDGTSQPLGDAKPVVVNEPPKDEKQPDLSVESEKQAEPAWIPHDGGPCPLKDEEVEEWEYKLLDGSIYKHSPPSERSWKHLDCFADIIAYRVLKWKPGFGPEADPYAELKAAHKNGKMIQMKLKDDPDGTWSDIPYPEWGGDPDEYRIKPEPATFQAHGKTWTRHTPGDPMPCNGGAMVQCVIADGDLWPGSFPAKDVRWTKNNNLGDVIGWRYADEPAQAQQAEADQSKNSHTLYRNAVEDLRSKRTALNWTRAQLNKSNDALRVLVSLWTKWPKVSAHQMQEACKIAKIIIGDDELAAEPAQPWTPAVGDTVRPTPEMALGGQMYWRDLAIQLAKVWWKCHGIGASLQHGDLDKDIAFSVVCERHGGKVFHADSPENAWHKAEEWLLSPDRENFPAACLTPVPNP